MTKNKSTSPRSVRQILSGLQKHFFRENDLGIERFSKSIDFIMARMSREQNSTPHWGERKSAFQQYFRKYEKLDDQAKDPHEVLAVVADVFSGLPKWHHSNVMNGITPPVMLEAAAVSAIANMLNGNALGDIASANILKLEQQIVGQFAAILGWGSNVDGAFTFGGKGCLLYAIRLGLNRCSRQSITEGFGSFQSSPVVFACETSHYTIEMSCSLLGVGSQNCVRVPSKRDGAMDTKVFGDMLEDCFESGVPVAAIVLSGGDAIDMNADEIHAAIQVVNWLVEKYGISYKPFIYLDLVAGWPWLFYKNYSFLDNPMKLDSTVLDAIERSVLQLKGTEMLDGVGVDFHKFGHCPYPSSLFLVRNQAEFHSINQIEVTALPQMPHGQNFMQFHTIEHSRSTGPIIAAWTAMQLTGVEGFRAYVANGITSAISIRNMMECEDFELLNGSGKGLGSVFAPILPGVTIHFSEFLKSNQETIHSYNQYVSIFHEALMADPHQKGEQFFVKHIKKYSRAVCGDPVAAIALQPMSLDLTVERLREQVAIIRKIKLQVDDKLG